MHEVNNKRMVYFPDEPLLVFVFFGPTGLELTTLLW